MGEKGEGIKEVQTAKKIVVTKESWVCNVQHR